MVQWVKMLSKPDYLGSNPEDPHSGGQKSALTTYVRQPVCPAPKSNVEYTILKRGSQKVEGLWGPARRMGSSF